MSHTPKPWGYDLLANAIFGDGRVLFRLINGSQHDLVLAAAAPDLLEACKAFVTAWEQCLQLEKTDVALQMAKAAIAKATNNEH